MPILDLYHGHLHEAGGETLDCIDHTYTAACLLITLHLPQSCHQLVVVYRQPVDPDALQFQVAKANGHDCRSTGNVGHDCPCFSEEQ